eukprot:NODE_705_length_4989_cov_0.075460.p4 type:complete len:103 gc:universal NODE_705_length_4989_cov_0.075460:4961-4653(-)
MKYKRIRIDRLQVDRERMALMSTQLMYCILLLFLSQDFESVSNHCADQLALSLSLRKSANLMRRRCSLTIGHREEKYEWQTHVHSITVLLGRYDHIYNTLNF